MKYLVLLLTAMALASCIGGNKTGADGSKATAALDSLANAYYEDGLKLNPLGATANGDYRYNDQFVNFSADSYRAQTKAFYTTYAEALAKIDTAGLDADHIISYKILKSEIDISLEGYQFPDQYLPIDQIGGLHLWFGQLGSGAGAQPFKTVKDYDDFLKRITGYAAWVDTSVEQMRKGMAAGVVLPKALVVKIIPELKDLMAKGSKSVFYMPITNLPADFAGADKERLTKAYTAAIDNELVSAHGRMLSFLEKEYLPKARTTTGYGDLPNGKAWYEYQVLASTTTNKTPDEVYQIGLDEVARITKEMEAVKDQLGYKGDVKSFLRSLSTDPKAFIFTSTPQVLDSFRAINTKMEPRLNELFGRKPKTAFEVRQTEKFREASASAEYNQGTPDGSRPGIFYTPIPDAKKFSKVGMESLFLHEAIPGHHYQISLQQEDTLLPKFRRFGGNNAYVEGWALYCESLGKELGLYTDPYQYIGRLDDEMLRAVRLVVDVGMHYKGMTREEAIQYMLDHLTHNEADATSAIERYMAWPGQALGYKIGELEIQRLRKYSQEQLGDKFDIKGYHDVVLLSGSVPLSVLESNVQTWVAAQKGK